MWKKGSIKTGSGTLRSLTLTSVLTHSDNRQVSDFVPSALHPNSRLSAQASDTCKTLGDIFHKNEEEIENV